MSLARNLGRRALVFSTVLLGVTALSSLPSRAATARVAVAANFLPTAAVLGEAFSAVTGHVVAFSAGATGQLFAQISQGAPFDVFLAADQARPTRAVRDGLAVAESQITYAVGRLVLYSRDPGRVNGAESLRGNDITRLAIANPATAPYGAAALDVLAHLGLNEALAPKLVRGNNVAQAYQFVATGNAELGFVALAQLSDRAGGSRWLVPQDWHAPIKQDAVLLAHAADNPAARAFLAYLHSAEAQAVIAAAGYALPGHA